MNDNVQKKLIEWLDKGADALTQEVPAFAKEIVAWEFWSGIFVASVCGAIFIAGTIVLAVLARNLWKKQASLDSPAADPYQIGILACSVAWMAIAAIFGGEVCHSGYCAVKASVAPRVVLIEKTAALLKR